MALGATLAYQPHFDYPYPLLGDEYNHISFGKYILEERALPFQNPYFATSSPVQNFESGFHILLAFLFLLIPGDPVLWYKFLVIAAFALNTFLLFYLVFLWSRNYWTALFSVFFFGTIKSEVGFLSHQYFLPLTLGVTLLLFAFIFFHRWANSRSRKSLFALTGTLAALALSYPPALFFFLGVMLVHALSMDHSLHEFFHLTKKRFFAYVLSGAVTISALFVAALSFFGLLSAIVFPPDWNVLQTHFSPIFFFGIIPSVFAAFGLVTVAISKHLSSKVALHWFLFSLGMLLLFYIFDFNVLIPAPRLFVFYLIGVSVLAGIGVSASIYFFTRYVHGRFALSCAIAVLCIPFFVHYYIVFSKPLAFHRILTPEIYKALATLHNEHPERAVVIADSFTSHAVYPVSGKYVVNLLNANIGGGNTEGARIFLEKDCRKRIEDVFDRLSYFTEEAGIPLFLLAKQQEMCRSMLEPVYEGGVYLYRLYISTSRNPHAYEALAGNTLEGDDWIEFYDKDGSIRGKVKSTGEIYTGTWDLRSRPRTCAVYPDFSKSECKTISIRGKNTLFFELGGIPMPQRNSVIISGNPYTL